MQSDAYLYGENTEVPKIPQEVIDGRVALLDVQLTELLAVDMYSRDGKRCNATLKALDFWNNINKKAI